MQISGSKSVVDEMHGTVIILHSRCLALTWLHWVTASIRLGTDFRVLGAL